MPAAILFYAALICLLPEGFTITIETKLDLPEPTMLIAPGRSAKSSTSFSQLDSSLSPKIIKAFYEINFVPTVDNQLTVDKKDEKNQLVLTMPTQKCPYNAFSNLCKFYYTTSKVTAVQQVDDIIQKANHESTDVPVVAGLVSPQEAANIVRKFDQSISKKVNPVVHVPGGSGQTGQSVPVFRGTVDTPSVLRRPEQFYPCSTRPCYRREAPYY